MKAVENRVLIVGSGPSGMIMAHELMRRGVPVRLIEKRQGPSKTTRAITIHARSMEMFEHMGFAYRLEEICLECPGNIYHFPGMARENQPKTDYRVLPTRFPFYYKINQNDFEQVLREHLFAQFSLKPEYETELVALEQEGEVVRATLRRPDGTQEERLYPWVVGCDGVRSFVREAAGIPFPGEDVAVMAMMDVELDKVDFDDRWMNYFFTKDLFMNCTKMPGKYWRVHMSDPEGHYVNAEDKRKAFQEVSDRIGIGMSFGEPAWVTAWTIRNNIASHYRNGRMIICGDASHVHSPSGGQGMNGCMQDAFNLGWKLAAVWKGDAADTILETYERERKPIGKLISDGAMATHEIVMGFGIEPEERWHLTQVEGWEPNTIRLVSGLSHNYRDVVQLPAGLTPVAGPRAGERAPDALMVREPRKRLYDVVRHPGFTLLVVPGADEASDLERARAVRDALEQRFAGQVASVLVGGQDDTGFDFDHQLADELGEMAVRYDIGPEGRMILIRPDLYVGMSCLPSEWKAIPEYLSQWFIPTADAVADLRQDAPGRRAAV